MLQNILLMKTGDTNANFVEKALWKFENFKITLTLIHEKSHICASCAGLLLQIKGIIENMKGVI